MQRLKSIIGVIAAISLMVPFVAAGGETFGPFECNEKVDEIFWIAFTNSCYQLKATCKGAAAGADVYAQRNFGEFSVSTEHTPGCSISSTDDSPGPFEALKGACTLDDAQTKLELKRRDDLCEVSCVKPLKDTGCV